jgi:hypothetical protein
VCYAGGAFGLMHCNELYQAPPIMTMQMPRRLRAVTLLPCPVMKNKPRTTATTPLST